jgi:hypothetical protein
MSRIILREDPVALLCHRMIEVCLTLRVLVLFLDHFFDFFLPFEFGVGFPLSEGHV